MICSSCHSINSDGAKFCTNCGAKLPIRCVNCGTELPAEAKFCSNCGHKVGDSATEAPTESPLTQHSPSPQTGIPQQLPGEMLAKLESVRSAGSMEGERRVVTMLFCDVKGSTAAASELDPEEWAEVMNGAYREFIQPVYQYEGTVARLLGDGLLAFFGAPLAHEDDPKRAVLAGLGIVAAVAGYREEVKRQWGLDFDVRVGINTGLVVVGAVGSDLHMEYTAVGDAINMAARMEQTAKVGTVQISETTHRLVSPFFEVEVLHDIEIKGKAETVPAYRVLGEKAEPESPRGIAGLQSPIVGRDSEMEGLRTAFTRLKQGQGQHVLVLGEAGLGKSRLIDEMRKELFSKRGEGPSDAPEAAGIQWLEGHSLSYETNTPFAPFAGIVSSYLGLNTNLRQYDKYAQLKDRLGEIFASRTEEIAPVLASLFSLPMPKDDSDRVRYMRPALLRGLIFRYVTEFFEELSSRQPLVLYLDDAHWFDPSSLELLEALLPLANERPMLMLVAMRPQPENEAWRLVESAQHDYAGILTTVELKPLDGDHTRELVSNLLHADELPEDARNVILEKADGNPFFVEEVIRSLLDDKLISQVDGQWHTTKDILSIAVPDTLVGVITARLDRLDESAHQVAQAASVLGREFGFTVLTGVYDNAHELEIGLAQLLDRDMIYPKADTRKRTYVFRHALTQEAAYASVLLSRRREYHRAAAESLIQHEPDRSADIGQHFIEARQPARALPYLIRAGDAALSSFSPSEAMKLYRQVIDLRATVESLETIQDAYEGLGEILTSTGQVLEAKQVYDEMLEIAGKREEVRMQISALNKLAALSGLQMGQFAEAEAYLDQAQKLAEGYDKSEGIAESTIIRCQMCTARAEFDEVVEHMNRLVDIGSEADNKHNVALGVVHVANSQLFLARIDEAEKAGQEALALAREIGHRGHEVEALWTLAMCRAIVGDFEEARKLGDEGLKIGRKIGDKFNHTLTAWLLAEMARWQGDYTQALVYGKEALDAALPLEDFAPFIVVQPLGSLGLVYDEISPVFTDEIAEFHHHALRLLESPSASNGGGTAWADLGWCALSLNDHDVAADSFEKGLHVPSVFMHLEKPRYLAGSALLALKQDRLDDAQALAREACDYVDEKGMRHMIPLVRYVAGLVNIASGQPDPALEDFAVGESAAKSMQMRPLLWQILSASANVHDSLGHAEEAEERHEAAHSTVRAIADLIEESELRRAFLINAEGQIKTQTGHAT